MEDPKTLYEFDADTDATKWVAVNDGVMGGLSEGRAAVEEAGRLTFRGAVSLENNGGFASIRSRGESMDLSEYDGLRIRLRGDGKRYAMSVQTDYPIMAGAYYSTIETKASEWVEVSLPFAEFEVRSFGRKISRAPELNREKVRSIGFLISDKQTGAFQLEIDWIQAFREAESATATDTPQDAKRDD